MLYGLNHQDKKPKEKPKLIRETKANKN